MQNKDLLKSSYAYDLPVELIASRPTENRDESRLLFFNQRSGEKKDLFFKNIIELIPENALLVANQSKVFPCRLFANKITGAKAEIFFLSVRPNQNHSYPCMIKSSSKKNLGDIFEFEGIQFSITTKKEDGTFELSVSGLEQSLEDFLYEKGSIPIPPYIRGGVSDDEDKVRYQTVFAKSTGSVAAPTAGLHFTEEIFSQLKQKGIDQAFVTLHVGLGTFAPVKVDDLANHQMHTENYFIDKQNLKIIQQAYQQGRPIIAIGTTTLRTLESCFDDIISNNFVPNEMKSTNIFLYPGKKIKSINGLVTNFHLPESTLLMLVSSLIGRQKVLELYQHAVEKKYRFFSYGDANLILL